MTAHDLARILLEGPDWPVKAKSMAQYFSDEAADEYEVTDVEAHDYGESAYIELS